MKKNKVIFISIGFVIVLIINACSTQRSYKKRHRNDDCGCWSHNTEIIYDASKSKV